ncbi:menaquinol-cytochrome c reductase cytochrome b/c subunit [Miltoncostaea oceani]|uniref:menaquinol-cytochrome c reductase cytochrome b/c subunit n=1 Tax=Miltoncostaea oceani TaxID=2843216 RepID=UPI001C3D984D|nr:menaquinol-cytochrome c reductase cytochrome b/c subunit [Miltoncostaea oceani]
MNRGQQEYYKRDYAQAKAEGKPFFPYAVYKDLIIATLAIGLVITFAIWHRVEMGEPVNPASTDFVPRPEWYFFFLFELLKIFKGQNALMPVIMATFIIPNILMVLLILTPFIDRNPERRIEKRPIALVTGIVVIAFLAYLTNKGASEEASAADGLPLSGLESNAAALAGSQLWLENCTSCHMIAGVGQPGPGPNLSDVGTKNVVSADTAEEFLKNPPGSMPAFANFTPEQYTQLGTFLEGLGTEYK